MINRISQILILGATRGIGLALARRFHALGKTVIITGRAHDEEKMQQLAKELPGLEYRWDLTSLPHLQHHVNEILSSFPNLDTVFLNAATQSYYSLFTLLSASTATSTIAEITTNLTAPILVAHAFASHLLSLSQSGTPTTIFITTSSLAYFPISFYPTYCATKAGLAAFTKILRMQLVEEEKKKSAGNGFVKEEGRGSGMRVVEVVPPYVDTGLDGEFREQTEALQGGKEKAVKPMPLEEYVDAFFEKLEGLGEGQEIAVGFAEEGVEVWKEGNRRLWEVVGMGG
ncbi:MAG: hypothetical protein Q9221_005467 [Calogaya cf. arnoldii]